MILTNCLSAKVDEGCLRLSNSLVKRIKQKYPDTYIATYDRESALSDLHLNLNKFFLNKELFSVVRKRKENVLYIPFPARPIATAIRVYVLSLACKKKLTVLFPMRIQVKRISKLLLKKSKADFVLFSSASADYYSQLFGEHRVKYLKSGVDTVRFSPVSDETVSELKIKYGFDPTRPVVLHVGHLNQGRGVGELMKLSSDFQVLLVVSTLTKNEQDTELKEKLMSCTNIRIIEDYLPDIQEIYQMCDVYFFPVFEEGRCIDIPLSCMEAASCNKPVITTDYGEMKNFRGKNGFCFIDSFESDVLNSSVLRLLSEKGVNSRDSVLEYDWDRTVHVFEKLV